MPQYILNRNYVHRSTLGVVSFEKGKPSHVPPMMEKEIMAIGGERADGTTIDPLDPEVIAKVPPSPMERRDDLFAAFQIIAERNDSKDFTGAGVPTVKAVEKLVDFDVDRNEVVEVWAEFKAAKAEDQ